MTTVKTTGSNRISIASVIAVIGSLTFSIVGCSVAQLQAGLEIPSEPVQLSAEKQAQLTEVPKSIRQYAQFNVPVTEEISVSVYARETDQATANVFMVHGAGGGAWVWEYYFEHLPKKFNLYALSWRGHFDSSSVLDANADDYVADQEAVLSAIASRNSLPVHIIGHSYGGATSVLQVARTENKVASLILLAPVVPLDYTLAQRLVVPTIAPYFIRKSAEKGNDPEGTYGGMFLSKQRMRRYHELYAGQAYSKEKPSLIAGDGVSASWQASLSESYKGVFRQSIPVTMYIARYDNVVVPQRQRETATSIDANLIEVESGSLYPFGRWCSRHNEVSHRQFIIDGLDLTRFYRHQNFRLLCQVCNFCSYLNRCLVAQRRM